MLVLLPVAPTLATMMTSSINVFAYNEILHTTALCLEHHLYIHCYLSSYMHACLLTKSINNRHTSSFFRGFYKRNMDILSFFV